MTAGQILSVEDQGDGTSLVTVATADWNQATIRMVNTTLGTPSADEVLKAVGDINGYGRTIPKRNAKSARKARG